MLSDDIRPSTSQEFPGSSSELHRPDTSISNQMLKDSSIDDSSQVPCFKCSKKFDHLMEQVARLASSNHELTNEVKDLESTLEHKD